jgi:hypothetical protein
MKKTLVINQELHDLLPPLSPSQFEKLETEIKRDGCLTPLTLWNDILIDGHNRYEICTKHDIKYQTVQKEFSSLAEVKLWMWTHQDGQRNLTRFGRIEFALKIKDVVTTQSKERQRAAGGDRKSTGKKSLVQNSAQAISNQKRTRQQIAEFAGVSHDTVDRVEYILAHADKETINALRWESKDISINKVFTDLKAANKTKQQAKVKKTKDSTTASTTSKKATTKESANASTPSMFLETDAVETDHTDEHIPEIVTVSLKSDPKISETYSCGVKFEPDPDDDYFDWITDEQRAELYEMRTTCPNRLVPQIHNFTIQNIPEHQPDQLINCLFSLFKPRYREKLAFALLRKMAATETDRENAHNIVTTLFHEFQTR